MVKLVELREREEKKVGVEQFMAKVCVSCQGNGEGFGGLEEVPSVLWVQFEGEDCAKALAFEKKGC